MPPLTASTIRGNWATLLLPIAEGDAIDYARLADTLDHFAAARVNGVYSNGSAGEFYTQSEEEFDCVNQLLAEKCSRAGLPFQIGVSQMSPQLALARLRRAKALQPSAFQVILPDWFVPQFSEILVFLEIMAAAAAPIPLIVYNPPHAKRHLTPAEWLEIADKIPGVAGMKVPGGDAAWYAAMQPVMRRLSVFVPGHLLATGIAQGAHGAYSNVACLSPGGAQRWYDLIVRDPAAGLRVQEKILAFFAEHITPLITRDKFSNMAVDKCLAVAGGWSSLTTRLRWPYRSVPMETALRFRPLVHAAIPELFSAG